MLNISIFQRYKFSIFCHSSKSDFKIIVNVYVLLLTSEHYCETFTEEITICICHMTLVLCHWMNIIFIKILQKLKNANEEVSFES